MSDPRREITLQFLAQPSDMNFGGKVHGGSAMKWLDQAGYVCATTWSGSYCVTAFVGDINFQQPIAVGHLVRADAKVVRTGRTSMHIVVDLYACSPRHRDFSHAIRCIMVFVAVDENGRPVPVPAWEPEQEDDLALQAYAERMIAMRQRNAEALGQLEQT